MANILAKDGNGNVVELAASGTGANADPFVRKHEVTKSALPQGAATETTLATLNGKTPSLINGKVPVEVGNFPATQPVSGTVTVGNLPATQPVSGTVSVSNLPATQPISATALPLPAGAATEATLVALSGKVPALSNGKTPVEVSNFPATQPVSGSVSVNNLPATQPVSGSVSVSNHPPFLFDATGNLRVSGISGSGTGTGTTTTPNTEYTEGSNPTTASGIVSLGRNSSNQLRPLALNSSNQALVSVANFPATQPISGSVSIGNFPATQPVSGSVSISNQPSFLFDANGLLRVTAPASQAVTGSVSVSNFPATQAISAASLPLPTGAATETTLAALNTKVPALSNGKLPVEVTFPATQPISGSISVSNFPATQPISGSVSISNQPPFLFDANGNLRVNFPTTQAVSGSVSISNFPGTQAISAASLPLPTGAASETTLSTLSGKLPSALASDRLKVDVAFPATQPVSGSVSISNFPATQPVSGSVSVSNFPATQPISATALPLPTGAATETTLATVAGRLPSAFTTTGGLNVSGSQVDIAARVPANIKRAPITASTSGDVSIITGVAGQKVKVLGLMLVANGDVNVIVKGGATNLTGSIPLASKGNGFILPQNFPGYHWLEGDVAGALILNLSAAVAVTGCLLYLQEA